MVLEPSTNPGWTSPFTAATSNMCFLMCFLALLLLVSAYAHPAVNPSSLRPNVRHYLAAVWFNDDGSLHWPPNDGFSAQPILVVLPPNLLIDRFGSTSGRFFSPKGASYGGRALPYICEKLRYAVYR